MHSRISSSAWLLWFATAAAQFCVLLVARKRERSVALYLALKLALTAVGMPVAAWGSGQAYFRVYQFAGLAGSFSSIILVLAWLERLRQRGRLCWSSPYIICGWAASCALLTLLLTRQGVANLAPSPWKLSDIAGHVVWTWIALMLSTIPGYCLLTGTMPDRCLAYLLTGFSLYVASNCGLLNVVVASVSGYPAFFTLLKFISDSAYLFSLALWITGLRHRSTLAFFPGKLLHPTERVA